MTLRKYCHRNLFLYYTEACAAPGHFYTTVACLSCTWACMDNMSRCCSRRCLDNKICTWTWQYKGLCCTWMYLHMDVYSLQGLEPHLDNRSLCFSWTYLHYRGLCCTLTCLQCRRLWCSLSCLQLSIGAWAAPGHIWTTIACAAPVDVSSLQGSVLHSELSTLKRPCLHHSTGAWALPAQQNHRDLCCIRTCLHWRGRVYTRAQGPELYLRNKSVSFSWTNLHYRVLCWTRMCLHWRGLCCSWRYLCQAQGPELRQDNRSMYCFWTYLHYKALFCNLTCFPYRGTSCTWTSLHYWVLCCT